MLNPNFRVFSYEIPSQINDLVKAVEGAAWNPRDVTLIASKDDEYLIERSLAQNGFIVARPDGPQLWQIWTNDPLFCVSFAASSFCAVGKAFLLECEPLKLEIQIERDPVWDSQRFYSRRSSKLRL